MPIKVNVIKNNKITNSGVFDNAELAEAWVEKLSSKGVFGKLGGWVHGLSLDRLGLKVEDASAQRESVLMGGHEYLFPQEFEVVYVSVPDPKISRDAQIFLNNTDWKILRHVGQKALGIQTSMSEQEYLALEAERQAKRLLIVKE